MNAAAPHSSSHTSIWVSAPVVQSGLQYGARAEYMRSIPLSHARPVP